MNCQDKYDIHSCKQLKKVHLYKLQAANVHTTTEFMLKTPESIADITGMPARDYERVTNEILTRCRPPTASLMEMLYTSGHVYSTGIKMLDDVLGGGLRGGEILEFFGLPSTGKTQMCMSLAANFARAEEYSVLYLDLKNDFNPLRFNELCQEKPEALDSIRVFRESKIKDIVQILENYETICSRKTSVIGETLRLVILDSLPLIFYPCDTGREESSRLYQERICQTLKRLASQHGVVVVQTNHAVNENFVPKRKGSVQGQSKSSTERLKPALGKYWANVSDFTLLLVQKNAAEFEAILTKSKRTRERQYFKFIVTKSGIET